MIGAIIGDIVGSRFEFNNTLTTDFEMFNDECSFTDDTICTIAIANALLEDKDYEHWVRFWCKKYDYPMGGYGCGFKNWLDMKIPRPYYSFGNGSAMRVSPVSWFYDSLHDVKREAERTALITHNHPEGIKGAVSIAHAIFALRNGVGIDGLIRIANEYYPKFMINKYELGKFDETCQGTIPLCFYLLSQSSGFEDAIRIAISWGGDSDTIGAIVGSMAEALWGVPNDYIEKVNDFLPKNMLEIITKFEYIKYGRKRNFARSI